MRRALLLATLSCLIADRAAAQAQGGVTAYPPAFFAEARPATALDMVRRLPGFSFEEGDEDVRGYAGSGGNVLIDGQRPASKRDGLDEILERIPAAAVERVELIRGGAPGIDMQGRTVLANVVRKAGGAAQGLVAAGADIHEDRIAPRLRLEGSRRWNGRFAEAALLLSEEVEDEGGQGPRRRYAPDGALVRDARLDQQGGAKLAELKGGYEQPLAGGELHANAALVSERTRLDSTETTAASLETVREDEDRREVEAGLRYERPLGPHTHLDLVAIQQLGALDAEEASLDDGEAERFTEETTFGESIIRAALRLERSPARSWELGAEAAFNFLESRTALEEDGVAQPLPGAQVRVEERRAEAFATLHWKPAATVTVEAALRLEVSTLSQTGDVELERTFTYPKPRLTLAWSPTDSQQLRLRFEREVGQLDFGDFAASASLDEDAVSAGAADLEPAKAWVAEAAWERRFWSDGALVLTLRHEAISDVVDRVLFVGTEDFDAPDNIGDGRRDSLEVALTLPLGPLHIPGGLLTAQGAWHETSVRDPTTGEDRRISGEEPFTGEIAFTQDLPRWKATWGVEASLAERKPEYRYDQVRLEGERTWLTAFVEVRPAKAWRVRVEAENLTSRETWLRREDYDGPRGANPLESVELRSAPFPAFLSIEIRRSFN